MTSVTAETVTLAWSFRSDITDDSIDGINLYYKAAYETSGFVDYGMGTSIEWTGETVTDLEPGQTYEFYLEVSFYGEPYQYASPVVTVTTSALDTPEGSVIRKVRPDKLMRYGNYPVHHELGLSATEKKEISETNKGRRRLAASRKRLRETPT